MPRTNDTGKQQQASARDRCIIVLRGLFLTLICRSAGLASLISVIRLLILLIIISALTYYNRIR